MNIENLSFELLSLKKEIKEIKERQESELKPKEDQLAVLQETFVNGLKEMGLSSIKTANASFSLASRVGFRFNNEIEAMKWAKKNNAVSIDKRLAGQVLKDLEELPPFIEKIESNYLTIKEKTNKK